MLLQGVNNISDDWDAFQKAMTENGGENSFKGDSKTGNRNKGSFDYPEEIKFIDKQIGKKFGKHKSAYPELNTPKEYIDLFENIKNPGKITYDSFHEEYYYVKGDDLLRIGKDGEFISLYPGASSGRVISAIEKGGLVWQHS